MLLKTEIKTLPQLLISTVFKLFVYSVNNKYNACLNLTVFHNIC